MANFPQIYHQLTATFTN